MQRVNEYRFYELGQQIKAVQDISWNDQLATYWYPLWTARNALSELKQDAVAFRISIAVVDRLIHAITNIIPWDVQKIIEKTKDNPDGTKPVVGHWANELTEAVKHFEPVLAAECLALDTYVISQKRGYSTPDLVERSDVMVSEETRVALPDSVVEDIRAAGRCLAFDVPTASGFHILRAVEAMMAQYYTHLTGKKVKKQNRNWGLYLLKLKGVAHHNAKIWGALEHVKENYRNPITHPEDTLSESEALMLFALSLSVIELMAEPIRNTTPALTEQEQLAALSEIAAQSAAASDSKEEDV